MKPDTKQKAKNNAVAGGAGVGLGAVAYLAMDMIAGLEGDWPKVTALTVAALVYAVVMMITRNK